jgi:hypothetical protein
MDQDLSMFSAILNKHMTHIFNKERIAFWRFSQNCEKRLLASSCLSVSPSARLERLGSHWTDFHEI